MKYIRVYCESGEVVVVKTKYLNKKLRLLKCSTPPDNDVSSLRTRHPSAFIGDQDDSVSSLNKYTIL